MEAIIQMMKQAIFMLGEEEYGLDIMDISIIEKVIPVETAAGLSGNFKGIINLRGDIIPVYSLRRRFGLEDIAYDDDTRFIITSSYGKLVAYEVDRVVEIIQIESDKLLDVPEIAINKESNYMKNVINYDGHLVIILDHDRIITEEEQVIVQKVTKK
jgi:purine-binding chemotaxis protein CheW